MSMGAILMAIFGCIVFYGGLAYCIYRAFHRIGKENEDFTDIEKLL